MREKMKFRKKKEIIVESEESSPTVEDWKSFMEKSYVPDSESSDSAVIETGASDSDFNLRIELELFRRTTFKLASLFFVTVLILFYVIPNVFWFVEMPAKYAGLTAFIITGMLALVFVFIIYSVNIPISIISKKTFEYWKDKQEFVELTDAEQEALASVREDKGEPKI